MRKSRRRSVFQRQTTRDELAKSLHSLLADRELFITYIWRMICEAPGSSPLEKMSGEVVARVVPTIVLADDHEQVRRTVVSVLQDEFQIVGIAENGVQVIELALSAHPDVIVLDIFMPLVGGIETAIRVKAFGCTSKVLFLTVDEDPDLAEMAMSIGALGYVVKSRLATDLIPAIRNALNGRVYISRSMHLSLPSVSS